MYLLITTFTYVFEAEYGFSTESAGLTFLGLGIGNIVGIVIIGPAVDKIFIYFVKKNNGLQKPEFRLPVMVFSSLSILTRLFWYGWSAHEHVHFVVPIIGNSFIGFGMISVMV